MSGMIIDGDTITFTSGRQVYANNGVVGLSEPDEYGWRVSEGYDGTVWNGIPSSLSADDMRELADYMIGLWGRFRDGLV